MTARDLLVSEIFGPTLQGEGQTLGKPCVFIRLGGCNLHCSWCDTPYTWLFTSRQLPFHDKVDKPFDPQTQLRRMTYAQVYAQVSDLWGSIPDRIVISGGEPMLQQDAIAAMLDEWFKIGIPVHTIEIEIETAGTRPPSDLLRTWGNIQYNVSPKLEHSGNPLGLRDVPDAIHALKDAGATFKFVCRDRSDLTDVHMWQNKYEVANQDIWIMPEGTTVEDTMRHLKAIVDEVIAMEWNMTPRFHTLIWGDERGR